MSVHGAPGGSKGLSEAFGVGVKYVRAGLLELRSNGLVNLITGKCGSQFWSSVQITDKGNEYLKMYKVRVPKRHTGPSAKRASSIPQNSNIADTYIADIPYSSEQYGLYANSVKKPTALKSAVDGEEEFGVMDMSLGGMPIDPDDLEDEIAKDRKRKKEEKAQAKRNAYAERQRIRANRPVVKWTETDVVNYFAERCFSHWRIDEIKSSSRPGFVAALKDFRATHDTNGEEEKELVDRWIDRLKVDSNRLDPVPIFYGLIKYAPSMLDDVRRALAPESTEAVEKAHERLSRMLGGDDV